MLLRKKSKEELKISREFRVIQAREIIDGKLYDTEKANQLCDNLYKTNNGDYFTCENITHRAHNEFTGIHPVNCTSVIEMRLSGIKPLTEQEFKDILGKTDVDKYIELFGEVEEA